MENGQIMFFDFIMERTQEGKKEAMAAALEENFKPPQEGNFDPDAFKRGIEVITSMLKPEAVGYLDFCPDDNERMRKLCLDTP
jgi:hypothetical protein